MPDGRIEFEISADGKKAYAEIDKVTDALKKNGNKWEQDAKKSTDNMTGSFTSMAKKIAGAITAAGIGKMLVDIGKDAIQAASDLEEVQNVVDVTFGDAGSVKIEKWAKNAGKQFGLTETQAKKFTSTLGAMMKSAGMTGDEIVQMSTDMSGLAADMASFYNLDFETAFQKIRAGISGETEPLKQLGINMSEANLNAFALAQGIEKTVAQMDQGEKTILRYQYLMQATADAQGDFARTSDGFANSTRLLETNIEQLKTNLGTILIPVANTVVGEINKILGALTSTGERTVLDDFADIDLKTEAKIAQIESTAQEARTLTGVLDEIGNKAKANKTAVGEMADNVPAGDKLKNLENLTDKLGEIETQAGESGTKITGMADGAPKGDTLNDLVSKLGGIKEKADDNQTAIAGMADDAPTGEKLKNLEAFETKLEGIETQAGTNKTAVGTMADDAPKEGKLKGLLDELGGIGSQAATDKTAIGNMADDAPKDVDLSSLTTALSGIEESAEKSKNAIGHIADNVPGDTNFSALEKKLEGLKGIADENKKAIGGMADTAPKDSNLDSLAEKVDGIGSQATADKNAIKGMADDVPTGEQLNPIIKEVKNVGNEARESKNVLDQLLDPTVKQIDNKSFQDIIKEINGIQTHAENAKDAVDDVTPAVEEAIEPTTEMAEQDALWLETCKQLVSTLPGLSGIIDTQTGEIKGGTQAVRDYIDAWEQGQKYLTYQSAHAQKQAALDTKYAELPGLELDMTVAKYRLKKQFEELKKLVGEYSGAILGQDANGNVRLDYSNVYGLTNEDIALLNQANETFVNFQGEYDKAAESYNKQKGAYDEAVTALNEEAEMLAGMGEKYQQATEAANEWSEAQKTATSEAVAGFQEALAAVDEYYGKIRSETASQVNSSLSGFEQIKSVTDQYIEALEKTEEGKKELEDLKKMFGEGFTLHINSQQAEKTLTDMISGLQSQMNYIDQYQKDLATAREKGLSEQLASFLSDGSEQSATYLNAIANASEDQIADLNKLYEDTEKKKEDFVTTLTNQKLEADKQYQELVEKSKTAWDDVVKAAQDAATDLDVSDDIKASTASNITTLANTIKQHVPDVADAVNDVLAELNRLNDWGVDLQLGNRTSVIKPATGKGNARNMNTIASFDVGTDWIPYDGMLAQLHEGEAVLTAEENRIWQRFKNGQRGVDYEQLGGVMRDNIKPGGSVYLDGRVVGQVVSQMQGNQYRTMQRSGWQQ